MKTILRLIIIFSLCLFLNRLETQPYLISTNNNSLRTLNKNIVWKFQTDSIIYASPVVFDNTIYVGSFDNNFYAIGAKSGIEKWRFYSNFPVQTTAAIHDNIICFASANQLYGLDINSGELKWQYALCSDTPIIKIDPWDYYHSSPAIVEGIVYIGSQGGFIHGVDVQTGTLEFQYQSPNNSAIRTRPLINNNKIYFADWAGSVFAVNLATHDLIWRYNTSAAIQSSPVFFNNCIYFAGRSTSVYSLHSETGQLNWSCRYPGGSWICGTPIVSDSVVYVGGSDNHLLIALNPISGIEVWLAQLDYNVFTTPIITENFVYVTTGYSGNIPNPNPLTPGSLYVIHKENGEIKNRFRVDGNIFSSPLLYDGIIYFGCDDGYIYAINQSTITAKGIPNTIFDSSVLVLGTISSDNEEMDTTLFIHNTGKEFDSVYVSQDNYIVDPPEAFSVEPKSFELAPGDSQAIIVTIKPSMLNTGNYYTKIIVDSKYNIGQTHFEKMIVFAIADLSVISDSKKNLPKSFSISQNYPNPFNMWTSINYYLPKNSDVVIKIFNSTGQEIKTLLSRFQTTGEKSIFWDATDNSGNPLSSGLYFCSFEFEDKKIYHKILLLK
jgi:eukaryotic-like serine/threonine-protein kinase